MKKVNISRIIQLLLITFLKMNRICIMMCFLLTVQTMTGLSIKSNNRKEPKATIIQDNCRFTVLTPRMIRLEWTEDGHFEDRASLVFVNRDLDVPDFNVTKENGWLFIKTSDVTLKYKIGTGSFKKSNVVMEGQTGTKRHL